MEFVISIGAKIAEYTVAPVGRQLGYLFLYTRNVDNLKTQVQNLNDAQNRLQRRVQDAQNNCQVIEADVTTWLTTFGQISQEANTFLNHGDHAKVVCSCGSPPHLLMRHRLSRKATKMSIQVHELKEECKFDTIAYPPHLHSLSPTITTAATTIETATATATTTATKGYESFDSRRVILEDIMAAVGDANRTRIGLHGMGGIGKTMLAKEIARRAKEEKLFSTVVITTISQAPNIKEIQQHIAEMLGMTIFNQNESIDKRAQLLQMRLKQDESTILLILDDIWNEFDVEAIGIHDGCKILVTSRYRQVLLESMQIPESNVFLIGALESSEAINLFKSIIGDTRVDYIKDLALKIVNECGGLPISIATVAHALKYKKEETIWKDALRRLKSSDVSDKVYSSIKLSYDFLGGHEKEEAKPLLLLCALHKEDQEIQVEDLIRYSMGWRLLQGIYTVSEARNRVNSLVDTLKSHCLLLDGTSTSDEVKMHDVIRDVCIKIAKEDHGHGHMMMNNITSAAMYEEFVFHERHKASKAISFLDYDDYYNLPQKLDCPMLELLLLSSWSYLESIPNDFFEQTGQLKVLGINGTSLRSLPSSFHLLQNLQSLCLCNSSLEDIAVIGELKNLKALDLSHSSFITRLPKEIGELRCLQVLDLRKCDNLIVIEANVISNLIRIEELYLPYTFEGWDKIVNEDGRIIKSASLTEIKSLQQIKALHLYVPSEHVLPKGLFTKRLERYGISIGGGDFPFYKYKEASSRMLRLQVSQLDQIYGSGSGLDLVMKGSEYLSLDGLNCVNNVFHDLHNDGFPRLKELSFGNNDGFHYIINSTHHQAFPSLESLTLEDLRSLESIICHGGNNKLPRGSFNELRKVEVRDCGRLKNLFPLSVAKLLHEIKVRGCEMMEEIIVMREDDDDDHSSSLELRSLHLNSLPKLVQFCCSNHTAPGESDHSKPLFSETVCFPNLEYLTIKRMNIEMLWPDQLVVLSSSSYMQNLTSLGVEGCHNVKYLFSFSLAQKFVSLKSIEVKDCEAMEDIIKVVNQPGEEESTHDDHDQMKMIDLLPKLQSLELYGLSALQRICGSDSSSCIAFPLISNILIEDCPKLKTLVKSPTATIPTQASVDHPQPLFNEKVSFPNLEALTMKGMNIEKLWPDQLIVSSTSYMQNLTSLNVGMCNNLRYLFSSSLAQEFVNLKNIKVKKCEAIEEIIGVVELGEEESTRDQMERADLFPKLESLELDDLSSLRRFCSAEKTSFPNLNVLTVWRCNKMKSLLSSHMARQLEILHVGECEKIEKVIVSDEEYSSLSLSGGSIIKAILPFEKLESIQLWSLPNLIRFCEGDYCIECPLLSGLEIKKCPKLKEFMGDKRAWSSCTTTNNKVILPKLRALRSDWSEGIKEIFEMSSNNDSVILFNLDTLELTCTSRDEPIGVPNLKLFLHKYHTIRTLLLWGSFVDLCSIGDGEFINDNATTTHFTSTPPSSSLERLHIWNAGMVDNVFGVESSSHNNTTILLFPHLKRIDIWGCRRLQSFAPSFMSFPNLETLRVERCHWLRYLLSSSTAATLVQLVEMEIRDCDEMKEIINIDNGNEEEDKSTHHHSLIVFQNLKVLKLQNLPNLQSFYSGNKVIMSFPNLKILSLKKCPKMRRFSDGILNTSASLLNTIKVDEEIIPLLERDVNANLTKLFKEHNNNNLGLPHLLAHQKDGDGDDDDMVDDDVDDEEFMGDKRTWSSCTNNNKVIFPMLKTLETDWSEVIKEIFE
ncbi:uncharacterized protein LOC115695606 [Cannabis sativa]|uniref:uncharacterized protein LOC115695606 n=1 Tax=Cannabis sativa TaxID=3483 RepID=UPI0029CA8C3F|nr:uncharacterized protein LOC115695606 [Cannabis sativa]